MVSHYKLGFYVTFTRLFWKSCIIQENCSYAEQLREVVIPGRTLLEKPLVAVCCA